MALALRDIQPGLAVHIPASVVTQRNGNTLLRIPGIGASGCWELPGSAIGMRAPAPAGLLVYLAGPIDGVSPDEALDWREAAASAAPQGMVFFSPCSAYLDTASGPAADRANRAIIRECDVLLANLLGGGLKLGTMREIEYARSLGKPVVVISEVAGASLAAHDLTVVPTQEQALELLPSYRDA